uniref:DNA mismatch repair protein MLH1 n=1 Tax=Timema bartmani TaxID=61472 RepID=A0A7R9EX92_9NEOP|nr:unnamed protein product [Timema bartmani]
MSKPGVIRKLDEAVINRIAAGEVIQRPSNALKEMIENSLDAKSSDIQINVHGGGLKLLQIQDNGTGIRKEDLEILCERFTTSKLEKFEDLSCIATYGFRGEALASISHIAHLTIKTKTAEDKCAFKASYADSRLLEQPKPCAGNQGTQITVEDLFYNVATRRKTLKSSSEEFAKLADMVGRYAIHNARVGFSLRKQGESMAVIRTPPNSSIVDNIRSIYGNAVSKEILEVEEVDQVLGVKLKGCITNVGYTAKKLTFLLFINNRLVESLALRKSIEQVYSVYLQKNCHPFLYISLELDPRTVDVNVHPTKHEVTFLYEDKIADKVRSAVEAKLLGNNALKHFYTQTRLPGASAPSTEVTTSDKTKVSANEMVRTDISIQKLDKFFPAANTSVSFNTGVSSTNNVFETNKFEPQKQCPQTGEKREIRLTSVLELRQSVENELHLGLRETVKNSTFVGCVSFKRAMIQHETKLYLCNTGKLCEEMLYQIMLYDFGNFGALKFTNSMPLYDLARMALDCEECGWKETDGTKEEIATTVVDHLVTRAAMLDDYFSMQIDGEGNLKSIPYLVDKFCPDMSGLPIYILRLTTEVEWDNERECFKTFCRETAKFYSELFTRDDVDDDILENATFQFEDSPKDSLVNWKWTVEHVIYPALKQKLLPPKRFIEDATILQIANLPDLYKVFERC